MKVKQILLNQSGQYSLIVENEYGKCSTVANVTVLTAPSSPLDFMAQKGKESIKLRWKPPLTSGGAKKIWYAVEYRKLGKFSTILTDYNKFNVILEFTQFHNVITGLTQTATQIFYLETNISYRFRVYAYNEAFRSNPTREISIKIHSSKN